MSPIQTAVLCLVLPALLGFAGYLLRLPSGAVLGVIVGLVLVWVFRSAKEPRRRCTKSSAAENAGREGPTE